MGINRDRPSLGGAGKPLSFKPCELIHAFHRHLGSSRRRSTRVPLSPAESGLPKSHKQIKAKLNPTKVRYFCSVTIQTDSAGDDYKVRLCRDSIINCSSQPLRTLT